jgi:hypothetical protein
MALTKESQDKIIQKINEVVKRKNKKLMKCPLCTNTEFRLVGGFTNNYLTDNLNGDLIVGGDFLPNVPIVCTNCGNTFFLNAKALGLNEDDFKKEIKNEEKKDG